MLRNSRVFPFPGSPVLDPKSCVKLVQAPLVTETLSGKGVLSVIDYYQKLGRDVPAAQIAGMRRGCRA